MRIIKNLVNLISLTVVISILLTGFNASASTNKIFAFSFNEVINGMVENSVSNKLEGTVNNTKLSSGIQESGMYFNGTNSNVVVKSNSNLSGINEFSISFWIKPQITNDLQGELAIVSLPNGYSISIDSQTRLLKFAVNTGVWGTENNILIANDNSMLNSNQWYFIIATYDGECLRLFKDGGLIDEKIIDTQDGSYKNDGIIPDNNSELYIGGEDSTGFFKGILDELYFYSACLTDVEAYDAYTAVMNNISNWNSISYPSLNDYPNGIEATDEQIWKETQKVFPLNTDFEERNEVSAINTQNYSNQLSVSEEAYSGKFSLMIKSLGNEILPLKETDEYFLGEIATENVSTFNLRNASSSDFSVKTDGRKVTVRGLAEPGEYVSIILLNEKGEIAYIHQEEADEDGYYKFYFLLSKDGDYTVKLTCSSWDSAVETTVNVKSEEQSETVEDYTIKTNIVNLWVKPMYRAEQLSFYFKTTVNGNDEYIRINSDKNADGIYKLGEDFSQGKWQNISINLLNFETSPESEFASGLYVKANAGSEWIFDTITSDYMVINDNMVNLEEFKKDNLEYSNEELKFKYLNAENKAYNTASVITTAKHNINEKISNIEIDSSYGKEDENIPIEEERVNLLPEETTTVTLTKNQIKAFNVGNLQTENRVTLKFKMQLPNTLSSALSNSDELKIKLSNGYERKISITDTALTEYTAILPPIAKNTVIRIENIGNYDVEITEFRLYDTIDTDVKKNYLYSKNKINAQAVYNTTNFNELGIDYNNLPGIEKKNYTGAYSDVGLNYEGITVVTIINPDYNTANDSYLFDGEESHQLNYGECEYVIEKDIYLLRVSSSSGNALITNVTNYGTSETNEEHNTTNPFIEGMQSNKVWYESSGSIVYYQNLNDNDLLYVKNLTTNEVRKISDEQIYSIDISPNGEYALFNKNRIYDYSKDEVTETETPNGTSYIDDSGKVYTFNIRGDGTGTNSRTTTLTVTSDSEQVLELGNDTYENGYNVAFSFKPHLSNSSKCVYIGNTLVGESGYIVKKSEFGWYMLKKTKINNVSDVVFDRNENNFYYTETRYTENTVFGVDIATGTVRNLGIKGKIMSITEDDRLLILTNEDTNEYTLFNPVTFEKTVATLNADSTKPVYYNSTLKQFVYINKNGRFEIYKTEDNSSLIKYLLSFDGMSNWYTFKGGRWIHAANGTTPTYSDFDNFGLTAEEVNKIKTADYAKLYENDTDILSVGFAMRFTSNSDYITPIIKGINIKTFDEENSGLLYGARIVKFTKEDYRKVNGIFPLENFDKPAECYYLLYLGDEWLYTYKNGKVVKLVKTATELFTDTKENWLEIKQYGMSQNELRNVPADVLTDLLVNENNANSEFGIIYSFRTDALATMNYTVDFKMQMEEKYFKKDELTLEISLTNNDVKILSPDKISKEEIENFMSWLNNRQNNKGPIFYRISSGDEEIFINYYMISSVNVLDYVPQTETVQETVEE